jgi:hypothetical protein
MEETSLKKTEQEQDEFSLPVSRIYLDYKLNEILNNKKALFEIEFLKDFRIFSTNVEYKAKIFYQRVKFFLEPNKLLCYEYNNQLDISNDVCTPLCVLDFDQLTVDVAIRVKSLKFRILVLGYNDEFKFKVTNKEIFEKVLIHLNYFINVSAGKQNNLLGISLRKEFYKVMIL